MKDVKPLVLNINTYSHYSLLSSTLSIDQIIDFAVSQNMAYVAISDTNLYGTMDFYLKCTKKNIKPLIGLNINYKNNDLIIYAKNFLGYKNLLKISSYIMTEKDFDIDKYLSEVFIISKNNNFTLNNISNVKIFNSHDIPFNESRFTDSKTKIIFNALNKIKNNETCSLEELNYGDDLPLLSLEETIKKFSNEQILLLNSEIQNVDLKIEFDKNNIINFVNPDNISSEFYLKKLCQEGLNNKILNNLIEEKNKNIYIDRMNEELKIINQMGFDDYFLIVQDFVNEAKNRSILVGPGRGSAAGSLVAYLLSITEVDPIKYNLLFERFLNPGRVSMPDIDIDIMDARRDEIISYIFEKYGYNHVSHIVTFQRIKSKMAIRDVGRILNKDLKEINKICKLVTPEYDDNLKGAIENIPELKKYYLDYKELFDISIGIIGCPRQIGLHAAGIVLSKKELMEIVPIQLSANGEIVTQYSMEFLEQLGLIKMDLLGLTNLTTIYTILKLVNKIHDIQINLDSINLNDNKVFEDVQKGFTLGIFQLESHGMTATVKKIKPTSIEDISICSAIYRPGPMQNIQTLVNRRNGLENIEYIDPKNKDILEPTYGIIVYQEQVINLVKKIANFSAYESDLFRRIISKKHGEELEYFKIKFFENAKKNGYSIEELEKIYTYIYTFADYGFNHSHSIAYSLISYWLLYLKHYFPTEFMTTLMMSVEGNGTKTSLYLNEAKRMNIDVLKPNINISDKSLSLYKRKILFGFNSIKGIGQETSKKIIGIRNKKKNSKFDNYVDAIKMLSNGGIGISILEILIYSGSFDYFGLSKKYMLKNLQDIINVSSMLNEDYSFKFEPRLVDVEEETKEEIQEFIKKEIDLLGFHFEEKNISSIDKKIIDKYKNLGIKSIQEIKDVDVFFDSIISIQNFSVKKTKKNTDMLVVKIKDIFGNISDVISFNKTLINSISSIDLTKKYLSTFKTSSYRLTLIKIKESVE